MFFIEVFSKTEKNALIQQIFLNGCGCTQLPAVAQSMGAGVDSPLQNPTGHCKNTALSMGEAKVWPWVIHTINFLLS